MRRILFFCLLFMYTDFCYSEQLNSTSDETAAFDTLLKQNSHDTSTEEFDTLISAPKDSAVVVKREKSDSAQSKKKKKEPFYANEAFVNSYSPNYGKVQDFAQYVEAGYKYKYKILPYVNVQAGLASKYLSLISTLDASLEFDYFQIGVTGLGGYLLFLKENQTFYRQYFNNIDNTSFSDTVSGSIKSRWLFEYITHLRFGTRKWNMSMSYTPGTFTSLGPNRYGFVDLSFTLNIVTIGACIDQLMVDYNVNHRVPYNVKGTRTRTSYAGYSGVYLALNNLIYIRNVKVTPMLYCSFFTATEDMVIRSTALFEW